MTAITTQSPTNPLALTQPALPQSTAGFQKVLNAHLSAQPHHIEKRGVSSSKGVAIEGMTLEQAESSVNYNHIQGSRLFGMGRPSGHVNNNGGVSSRVQPEVFVEMLQAHNIDTIYPLDFQFAGRMRPYYANAEASGVEVIRGDLQRIRDFNDEALFNGLEGNVPIISNLLDDGRSVLIHCAAGVQRTPTMMVGVELFRRIREATDNGQSISTEANQPNMFTSSRTPQTFPMVNEILSEFANQGIADVNHKVLNRYYRMLLEQLPFSLPSSHPNHNLYPTNRKPDDDEGGAGGFGGPSVGGPSTGGFQPTYTKSSTGGTGNQIPTGDGGKAARTAARLEAWDREGIPNPPINIQNNILPMVQMLNDIPHPAAFVDKHLASAEYDGTKYGFNIPDPKTAVVLDNEGKVVNDAAGNPHSVSSYFLKNEYIPYGYTIGQKMEGSSYQQLTTPDDTWYKVNQMLKDMDLQGDMTKEVNSFFANNHDAMASYKSAMLQDNLLQAAKTASADDPHAVRTEDVSLLANVLAKREAAPNGMAIGQPTIYGYPSHDLLTVSNPDSSVMLISTQLGADPSKHTARRFNSEAEMVNWMKKEENREFVIGHFTAKDQANSAIYSGVRDTLASNWFTPDSGYYSSKVVPLDAEALANTLVDSAKHQLSEDIDNLVYSDAEYTSDVVMDVVQYTAIAASVVLGVATGGLAAPLAAGAVAATTGLANAFDNQLNGDVSRRRSSTSFSLEIAGSLASMIPWGAAAKAGFKVASPVLTSSAQRAFSFINRLGSSGASSWDELIPLVSTASKLKIP